MDLIERYLHAIEFWLPKSQRQDILAEISEDIYSQKEEQEAALGRSLREEETAALLQERGRPMMVANRFQPQHSLIGPVLFPLYLFVLKAVVLFYLIPGLAAAVVLQRTQHPGAPGSWTSWAKTFEAAGSHICTAGLVALGAITAVFAALQLSGVAERELAKWSPDSLPPVKSRNRISRTWSVTNIVANLIFLLWWIPCFSSPEILHGPGIALTFEPAWMYVFWAFLATGVWNIGLGIANLLHPQWSRTRAACYLASNLTAGLLFCWMTHTHLVASLWVAKLGLEKSAQLAHAVESILAACFPIALLVTAGILMVDLLRVMRAGEQRA